MSDASQQVFGDGHYQLPAVVARNERTVREGFWRKLARHLAAVPFAEEAVAAFNCAFDPATPLKAKAILVAALAYFIMPVDLVPDFIAGLGFTDDLTVIAVAVGLVRQHITPRHVAAARATIARLKSGGPPPGRARGVDANQGKGRGFSVGF
jgi:uncharacterized membrane protein YkvA (DUF1232 family)